MIRGIGKRLVNDSAVLTTMLSGYRYLNNKGKVRSIRSGMPVDASGTPIPWMSYPAIEFYDWWLETKDASRVIEYGSGNSTLWLASRVESVVTVEEDPDWAEIIKKRSGSNVTVLSPTRSDYVTAPIQYAPADVVVVDGARIEECIEIMSELVAADGLIILYDSDRFDPDDFSNLLGTGHRELVLCGPTPIGVASSSTSFFVRGDCDG